MHIHAYICDSYVRNKLPIWIDRDRSIDPQLPEKNTERLNDMVVRAILHEPHINSTYIYTNYKHIY